MQSPTRAAPPRDPPTGPSVQRPRQIRRLHGLIEHAPWSQGFPLTTPLPGGPPLPGRVDVTPDDRLYPKAWGHPLLREAIAAYYNTTYGSRLAPENVMVFAGGRPGNYTVLAFPRSTSKCASATSSGPTTSTS